MNKVRRSYYGRESTSGQGIAERERVTGISGLRRYKNERAFE